MSKASEEMMKRLTEGQASGGDMLITKLGEPRPASPMMIELPNGDEVPEDEFGKPPVDLPTADLTAWFEKRAAKLMSQGYVDNNDDD